MNTALCGYFMMKPPFLHQITKSACVNEKLFMPN